MPSVERELMEITSQTDQAKGEKRQTYLNRVLDAANELSAAEWDSLSTDAQIWVSENVALCNNHKPLYEFPALETEAENEVATAVADEPEVDDLDEPVNDENVGEEELKLDDEILAEESDPEIKAEIKEEIRDDAVNMGGPNKIAQEEPPKRRPGRPRKLPELDAAPAPAKAVKAAPAPKVVAAVPVARPVREVRKPEVAKAPEPVAAPVARPVIAPLLPVLEDEGAFDFLTTMVYTKDAKTTAQQFYDAMREKKYRMDVDNFKESLKLLRRICSTIKKVESSKK